MKKRLLSVLLVAVMAVSLAACGDTKKTGDDKASDADLDSNALGTLYEKGEADGETQEVGEADTEGQALDAAGKHHVEITV